MPRRDYVRRKYPEHLVDEIRKKQYETTMIDVPVTVKPIPDCDVKGAMDPRLYDSQKKMALMMRFLPKKMMQMDFSMKGVQRLRKLFNKVDSTHFVEGVKETLFTVKADDGYEIPMVRFESSNTLDNAPILYFIHGGGFFAGSSDVIAEALRYIVDRTGVIAIGVNYRLAPENPYPRGHKDTYQALEWVYDNATSFGADPNKIFVAGDSAGGNLTIYCSNQCINNNKRMIRGQIILYPTVNMGGIKDEYTEFSIDKFEMYDKHRKLLEPGIMMFADAQVSIGQVLGTDEIMNVDLTPYMEVSAKMPPTFMTCGEHDALIIESLAYARQLVEQGVPTTFTMYKGMGHAYIDHMGNYPQAEDCSIDIGNFILKESGLIIE